MLFILGSILVGFMLSEALKKDPPTEHVTSSNVSFKVKEEVGVLNLPSCNFTLPFSLVRPKISVR